MEPKMFILFGVIVLFGVFELRTHAHTYTARGGDTHTHISVVSLFQRVYPRLQGLRGGPGVPAVQDPRLQEDRHLHRLCVATCDRGFHWHEVRLSPVSLPTAGGYVVLFSTFKTTIFRIPTYGGFNWLRRVLVTSSCLLLHHLARSHYLQP